MSEAWTDLDRASMSHALSLAALGLHTTDPNPRVGCVVVRDGVTVGEGWHERAGEPHAEVHALQRAGALARDATVYVTLEPCNHTGRTPPCTAALIAAGVRRVVYAMDDPNATATGGAAALRAAGIEVAGGLMGEAAEELNAGYARRMRGGLPWVRVKLAMSLDGRTALGNGASRWITADAARKDAQQYRARSSAVITGIGTILVDDPAMNVRVPGASRQPWRIVLDGSMRTPPAARIVNREGQVLVFASQENASARAALEQAGATVEVLDAPGGRLPLRTILERCAALGMNEVWVEAGPTLAGAFVQAGLADELIVYVAPALLGDGAMPLMHLPALVDLEQRHRLEFTDVRMIGADLRITARPAPAEPA